VTTTIGGLLVLARMADDAVLRNFNAHMNSSERQSAGMGGERACMTIQIGIIFACHRSGNFHCGGEHETDATARDCGNFVVLNDLVIERRKHDGQNSDRRR
jgi:hypothetical protein